MPTGDSITVGDTDPGSWTVPYEDGYRYDLFSQLTAAGVCVQYVGGSSEPYSGPSSAPPNPPSPDLRAIGQDNFEGYAGEGTAFIAGNIDGWLNTYNPNLILLDIGINDIQGGGSAAPTMAETGLQTIVQDVVTTDPSARLIVAQITPYSVYTDSTVQYNSWIRNTLLPEYAADNVSTVDLYTPMTANGQPVVSLFANGENHPDAAGYAMMADAWFNAIMGIQPNDLIWNNAGGAGDGRVWDAAVSQNWNNGSPAMFQQYDNVTFNDANNGSYNVTLNGTVTPTSVTFANSAGSYTLSGTGGISGAGYLDVTGGGTVTISTSNSYTGPTTITSGTLVVGAATALPPTTFLTIGAGDYSTPAKVQLAEGIGQVTLSNLLIYFPGILDISNNSVLVNYEPGSSFMLSVLRSSLDSGYAGGAWTGHGIESGAVGSNVGLYSVGYADGSVDQGTPAGPDQFLIKYTLAGDANLDGTVNFADLLVVAQNFNHALDTHGNPIDWADGDFNYDGNVNFADLLLVAQNFNKQLSAGQLEQLPGSFAAAWELALAQVQRAQSSNVPEPGTSSLLALGAAGLLTRRRRAGLAAK
jgi:autotransporter-associated beta strand protein